MSRDEEICSFFCIDVVSNERRRRVADVIVKLDSSEADVAAEHTESLFGL